MGPILRQIRGRRSPDPENYVGLRTLGKAYRLSNARADSEAKRIADRLNEVENGAADDLVGRDLLFLGLTLAQQRGAYGTYAGGASVRTDKDASAVLESAEEYLDSEGETRLFQEAAVLRYWLDRRRPDSLTQFALRDRPAWSRDRGIENMARRLGMIKMGESPRRRKEVLRVIAARRAEILKLISESRLWRQVRDRAARLKRREESRKRTRARTARLGGSPALKYQYQEMRARPGGADYLAALGRFENAQGGK